MRPQLWLVTGQCEGTVCFSSMMWYCAMFVKSPYLPGMSTEVFAGGWCAAGICFKAALSVGRGAAPTDVGCLQEEYLGTRIVSGPLFLLLCIRPDSRSSQCWWRRKSVNRSVEWPFWFNKSWHLAGPATPLEREPPWHPGQCDVWGRPRGECYVPKSGGLGCACGDSHSVHEHAALAMSP